MRLIERQTEVWRLRVDASRTARSLAAGGSIAVNGCCLTAVDVDRRGFLCQLTAETLQRTTFGRLRAGALVNLERPIRATGRFDGHFVQGHVDGVGRIRSIKRRGGAAEMRIEYPVGLRRYVAEKGSITVDGISLTVAASDARAFAVALIPYTLDNTNLRQARRGDWVNLETDVIAKYVERLLGTRAVSGVRVRTR